MLASINWPQLGELALRLLIAGVLGGLVGFEREYSNRPAGLRTHIVVCLGSALVMVTAEFIFNKYSGQIAIDPTRMGAQVISGIGFLGAGTILRTGDSIRGLTTAAGVWAVACIGLAVGSGFYAGALIATAFTVVTLLLTHPLERWHDSKHGQTKIVVQLASFSSDVSIIIDSLLQSSAAVDNFQIVPDDDNGFRLNLKLRGVDARQKANMISSLGRLPDIISVYEEKD